VNQERRSAGVHDATSQPSNMRACIAQVDDSDLPQEAIVAQQIGANGRISGAPVPSQGRRGEKAKSKKGGEPMRGRARVSFFALSRLPR
jgi:hypothetical protein